MTKFLTKEGHEIKANTLYEAVNLYEGVKTLTLFFVSAIDHEIGIIYGTRTGLKTGDSFSDGNMLIRPHQPIPGAFTEDGTPICIGWEYKRRDGSVDSIIRLNANRSARYFIDGEKDTYTMTGSVCNDWVAEPHDLITRHIPEKVDSEGWIKHDGNAYPDLKLGDFVETKTRHGGFSKNYSACELYDGFIHKNSFKDIMEYRLSREK